MVPPAPVPVVIALPKGPLAGFWQFVKHGQSLWKWVLIAAGSSCLLDLLVEVGPPYPKRAAVAFFTVVIEILIYIFCYQFFKPRARARVEKLLNNAYILVAVALLIYICLYIVAVVRLPDGASTDVKGLSLTDSAKQQLGAEPPLTVEDLIDRANNNVKKIFIPWTVDVMRVVVLLTWMALFGCITLCFTLFLILQYKASKVQRRP